MNPPNESAIVQRILKFLNALPRCVARKRWSGGMGVAGDPDITGCLNGRHLEFEVKRAGQQPTVLQARRLEEWRRPGAVVAFVTSVEIPPSMRISAACASLTGSIQPRPGPIHLQRM